MTAGGGGHPSDMIPALLAMGETARATPREVLTAIMLAYELLGALGTAAPIREYGWDQGTFMAPSAALAIGHLLRFTNEQLANAMALAMVPAPAALRHQGRQAVDVEGLLDRRGDAQRDLRRRAGA